VSGPFRKPQECRHSPVCARAVISFSAGNKESVVATGTARTIKP
jgi:hypothetical protein